MVGHAGGEQARTGGEQGGVQVGNRWGTGGEQVGY